ncbi:MAG: polyprenyl synthetase family protein [Clostridiaceae bacterium]|nr:polyprenyl synthetase family protein [Clostridiaceae bacterium]
MDYKAEFQNLQGLVNNYIKSYFDDLLKSSVLEKNLINSMAYSIMSGGKRIRPVLSLATAKVLIGSADEVMPIAAAIEMIHTYSLIHDDLPAMDNDDFRRGIATNHKVYGEAMAILAGDALLNEAFELLLKTSLNSESGMEQMIKASVIISEAAGKCGMIGGQVIDMESERNEVPAELLKQMHRKKTGALLKACILAPAVFLGASGEVTDALSEYAEHIGVAFQIKDDILDVVSTAEELGKPVGSDAKNMKTTYVSIYGVDKAGKMLRDTTNKAIDALGCFGSEAWFLRETALYIANRSN